MFVFCFSYEHAFRRNYVAVLNKTELLKNLALLSETKKKKKNPQSLFRTYVRFELGYNAVVDVTAFAHIYGRARARYRPLYAYYTCT